MNKDVIYIDVDEDITEIIGKVKQSKEKIVALVPPKRIGVLQSVVNLRILDHAAKAVNKRIVLISNDQALTTLAASVKIPVAKNLQTKPEVPTITALKADDDDDIIDGADLPVGDHVSASKKSSDNLGGVALADIDIDGTNEAEGYAKPPKDGKLPPKPNKSKKVPNFNSFRKKLIIIGGALLVLIVAFIWAQFFAYGATVTIASKTHDEQLNSSVQLVPDKPTDALNGELHSIVETEEKEMTIDFTATGEKEIGEKSSGTMTLSRSIPSDKNVPAGSGFSNGNCTFITSQDVTVPGSKPQWNGSGFSNVPGTVDVSVSASEVGEQCNLSERSYDSSVDGVSANGGDMTGGSKKTIKIVTQEDIQTASERLIEQADDDIKANLERKFSKNTYVIAESYQAEGTKAQSTPKVGEEAGDGKATLKTTMTYTMTGIDYSDLKQFITEAVEAGLSQENSQRVYEAGEKSAEISDFNPGKDNTATINILATSQVGPDIDVEDVKKRVKGKQFGDIQDDIESISGVESVELDLFPFWRNKVPEDLNRITVKFDMQDNAS